MIVPGAIDGDRRFLHDQQLADACCRPSPTSEPETAVKFASVDRGRRQDVQRLLSLDVVSHWIV